MNPCFLNFPRALPLRNAIRTVPLIHQHRRPLIHHNPSYPQLIQTRMSNSASAPKPHLAAMDDVIKGRFIRKPSVFRNWISTQPDAKFTPDANRYRLYVSLACPWACRCLTVRALKGLQDVIPVTVVHHHMGPNGWRFVTADEKDIPDMCEPEPLFGFTSIRDLYFKANPEYEGRFTVPALWDTKHNTIVNNESSEIIQMFNNRFNKHAKNPDLDLYPEANQTQISEIAESFYNSVNNGVYRCGFATTQEAYDEAVVELFAKLDDLEKHLTTSRYLVGSSLTLADIRLFVTLIRFDPVYVLHFKTNIRRIMDYPALSAYTRELYQIPEVRETVSFEHIKKHYMGSHKTINPLGIIAAGPDLAYMEEPHGRDSM